MSLQLAAQHLANKGRGDDKVLVHMSRKEVKSLNDLAMAHGGQLTINPETGLPEAGFLSSMLPMLAGMALAPATGGASLGLTSAWQTAALVGAGSYLLNPKGGLMGGLKAGLGAYGGAGLGEALAQQGMQQAAGQKIAEEQATNIAGSMAPTPDVIPRLVDPAAAYAQGTPLSAMSPLDRATLFDAGTTTPLSPLQAGVGATPAQLAAVKPTDFAGRMSNLGSGINSAVTSPGGASNLVKNMGGGFRAATTAASALSPALLEEKAAPGAPVVDKDLGQRYTYSPGVAKPLPAADVPTYEDMLTKQGNFGKQQNYYPNQGYTPISNDEAKSMYGFAGGGPVEAMSNANAIGANTGFPQAYLHNNAYATPYQTPISQNVLTGAGDVSVDPYTGEQRMASGGKTANKPENRDVDIYNDTNGPGSADGPSSSSTSSNGSPTGSTIGDAGYAISNQSFSPLAAAIAQAAMDAMSSTSNVSVNATNGMDVQSDTATAGGASTSAGVDGPAGASSNGMGSDTAGDSSGPGEARGGLSPRFKYHMATGGISDAHYNLGGYSDGGRLLRGPGDGVSDSIPAVIGKKQPARLADGEFVVPARIVSELGNGSTEAGARRLYAMMDRVQAARGKTVGKGRVARNTRADKYLPA